MMKSALNTVGSYGKSASKSLSLPLAAHFQISTQPYKTLSTAGVWKQTNALTSSSLNPGQTLALKPSTATLTTRGFFGEPWGTLFTLLLFLRVSELESEKRNSDLRLWQMKNKTAKAKQVIKIPVNHSVNTEQNSWQATSIHKRIADLLNPILDENREVIEEDISWRPENLITFNIDSAKPLIPQIRLIPDKVKQLIYNMHGEEILEILLQDSKFYSEAKDFIADFSEFRPEKVDCVCAKLLLPSEKFIPEFLPILLDFASKYKGEVAQELTSPGFMRIILTHTDFSVQKRMLKWWLEQGLETGSGLTFNELLVPFIENGNINHLKSIIEHLKSFHSPELLSQYFEEHAVVKALSRAEPLILIYLNCWAEQNKIMFPLDRIFIKACVLDENDLVRNFAKYFSLSKETLMGGLRMTTDEQVRKQIFIALCQKHNPSKQELTELLIKQDFKDGILKEAFAKAPPETQQNIIFILCENDNDCLAKELMVLSAGDKGHNSAFAFSNQKPKLSFSDRYYAFIWGPEVLQKGNSTANDHGRY
jgi:hypothetical protein